MSATGTSAIKTLIVVAGAIGTFAGGFYAATRGRVEAAPIGLDLKLEAVLTKVEALTKDMQAVKCRLNIENVCPPER